MSAEILSLEQALRKILRHWPFERMRLADANPDGLMGVFMITCERDASAQKLAAQCDGHLAVVYVSVPDARERTRILNEVRERILF
jgi:hypothetical protein